MTPVHMQAVPAVVPGFTRNAGSTPWMGDARFAAVLFYASGSNPTMRARGKMTKTQTTKIFWWVAEGGNTLVVRGKERASGRSFSQVVEGIGGGQFPSVPVVPSAGCWTLTGSIGGREVGAITIPVVAALAA